MSIQNSSSWQLISYLNSIQGNPKLFTRKGSWVISVTLFIFKSIENLKQIWPVIDLSVLHTVLLTIYINRDNNATYIELFTLSKNDTIP